MTDPDRRHGDTDDTTEDSRSDIQQAVEARADALERSDGAPEPDAQMGEGGADGVVKNQDRDIGQ